MPLYNKKGIPLINELEQDRKYDSYYDEYKRILSTGKRIITKIRDKDKEVWEYALNLFISSFKPKVFLYEIVKNAKFKSGSNEIKILEFKKDSIIAIEQIGKDGTIKRTTINKNRPTLFGKYSNIDYQVFYKSQEKQFGLSSSMNIMLIKRREKHIAASLASKISNKFNVGLEPWAKRAMNKK